MDLKVLEGALASLERIIRQASTFPEDALAVLTALEGKDPSGVDLVHIDDASKRMWQQSFRERIDLTQDQIQILYIAALKEKYKV